jgi:serine/threonine protein kinase
MPEESSPRQPLREADSEGALTDPRPPGALGDPSDSGSSTGTENPDSLVGSSFGDFELLAEIGRGGMGVVYKAKQKSLDRVVALKLLPTNPSRSQTVLARFLAEARAAAALAHPNIVTIFQVGECACGHYFAMEYVDGPTLEAVLRKGRLPIPWAVGLLIPVAEALHYAHGKGIIHRDLKPANIVIDHHHRPVIMDFGIAKMVGQTANLTQEGVIVGTPAFMSPEQARSGATPVGPRSDVYSLGAILYTLLAGRLPFDEGTTVDTLLKVVSADPPPPVRDFRPEVPVALERICLKCLSKDPADRPRTARALADGLRRIMAILPSTKSGSSGDRRKVPSVLLLAHETGKPLRMFNGTTLIGRASECDIVLKSQDVSKRHCQILLEGGRVVLEDLNSSNGTCVNGQAVEKCVLQDGDEVDIAGYVFTVRLPAGKS